MIRKNKKQFFISPGFMVNSFIFCLVFLLVYLSVPVEVFSEEGAGLVEGQKAKQGLADRIEYSAADFRDPFEPQIFITKMEEDTMQGTIEEVKPKASDLFSLSIQGIIWNSENPLVIINNQVLKKGDTFLMSKDEDTTEEISITEIDRDEVTITYLGEIEKLPYFRLRNPDNTK